VSAYKNTVNEKAINKKMGQLKAELTFLADEIEAIGRHAMEQPEKYGPEALEELRHSHMGEVLRLRSELDGLEGALLALKIAL
jgi:hypothetical protein|tara:strand:- start:453 stop:701 length:249 start_codon:yes stop_codon:yes gene_type:complete